MTSLKKCINKIDHKESKSLMETNNDAQDGNGELGLQLFCVWWTKTQLVPCFSYLTLKGVKIMM